MFTHLVRAVLVHRISELKIHLLKVEKAAGGKGVHLSTAEPQCRGRYRGGGKLTEKKLFPYHFILYPSGGRSTARLPKCDVHLSSFFFSLNLGFD